ncbi:hypothetical protein ACEPAH_3833 [Sanghuangporus vaninii]
MRFVYLISTLMFVGTTFAVRAGFDNAFDNAAGDMNTVSCSTGFNGLASQFPTFGSLPTFPNIGGASAIAGFDSTECGSCWQLTFPTTGKSINVTAIDHAGDGFNLSQEALDELTNGNAVAVGAIQVDAVEVDRSACGL